MSILIIERRETFSYGHYLPEYVGPCCYQHGHNAELKVGVAIEEDGFRCVREDKMGSPYTGMVMDANLLKNLIREKIIFVLDHRNINSLPLDTIEERSYVEMVKNPTAENMVLWIVEKMQEAISVYSGSGPYSVYLYSVSIWETENTCIKWRAKS